MQELRLHLLGSPRVYLNSERLSGFATTKAQGLLYYLAVTGQSHSREALSTLFWPETTTKKARNNLRGILPNLRRLVGTHLEISRQTITFKRCSPTWLDVGVLQTVLTTPANTSLETLAKTLSLYDGEFLTGFYVPQAPAFEEWTLLQREHVRMLVIKGLVCLAVKCIEQQAYELGLSATQRLLTLEPWQESGHQQQMILLYKLGQRQAALAQYEICRKFLADEFGITPSSKTVTLYEQIKNEQLNDHSRPTSPQILQNGFVTTSPVPWSSVSPALNWQLVQPPHNITALLNPLIGRETELTYIIEKLQNADCRLLTVVGMGGVGKTRLGLEAASHFARPDSFIAANNFDPTAFEQMNLFVDGVFFVSLAGLEAATSETSQSSRGALVQAIVETLGLNLQSEIAPIQQLLDYLSTKQMLLILDNFEHLRPISNLVKEMLHSAPKLKVLITSRVRLGINGEWSLPLEGLTLYNKHQPHSWRNCAACQLFVQRAQQLNPHFKVTTNEEQIFQICQLVWGLPLGIELAASWLRVYKCETIAQKLIDSLDFLSTTRHDIPARHRTLRAVFEHSWSLLTAPEQATLKRLSIFRGEFSHQAAVTIGQTTALALARLTDLSFVRFVAEDRYDIHELTRYYITEKRKALPHLDNDVHQAHCEYYEKWLIAYTDKLCVLPERGTLQAFKLEFKDIRRAWHWAVAQQRFSTLQCLAKPLAFCCVESGYFDEGFVLFDEALAQLALSDLPDTVQARLLIWRGDFHLYSARYIQAQADFEAGLALLSSVDPTALQTSALDNLSFTLILTNQFVEARTYANQYLRLGQCIKDQDAEAGASRLLGIIAYCMGDCRQAIQYLQQALNLFQAIDHEIGVTMCLTDLGDVFVYCGNFSRATDYLSKAARLSDGLDQAFVRWHRARLSWYRQDFILMHNQAQRAIEMLPTSFWLKGHLFNLLGHGLLGQHRREAAAAAYHSSLDLFQKDSRTNQMMESMAGLAAVAWQQNRLSKALDYVESILAHLEKHNLDGTDDRFQVYLICFEVLAALNDNRSRTILTDAYQLLQSQANCFEDNKQRRQFLEKIPSRQQIVSLYHSLS